MGWFVLGFAAILLAVFVFANITRHVVHAGQVGLLYREEAFLTSLEPGVYRRFAPFRKERIVAVSTVPTALHATQYEVISKDQFAFRISLAPLVTITDPREYHEGTPPVPADMAQFYAGPDMRYTRLAPTLSAALIEAVAARTLEEFLADPNGTLVGIAEEVSNVLPGTRLDRIALTSVVLPPETRKMFTEVERARREGLAGLERAKSEQASLRALANAARNLASNPQLAQLRVLQTMENAKGAKTFVFGNPQDGRIEDPASKG